MKSVTRYASSVERLVGAYYYTPLLMLLKASFPQANPWFDKLTMTGNVTMSLSGIRKALKRENGFQLKDCRNDRETN